MGNIILLWSFLLGSLNTQTMNLSVSINRHANDVYAFIANPENLPQWAAGLATSVQKTATPNIWLVSRGGVQASVRFTEKNKFRVADHYVTNGTNPEVYIPIRVLEHNAGSEVVFTLFRLPGMTDDEFKRDMGAVQKDLETIKKIMER